MSKDWNEKPQKDYMGCIAWSRSTCGAPRAMFGSEIKTSNPVTLTIDTAHVVSHGCGDESILPDHKPIIEIEMTPVQWAELLTLGNVSGSVPCTIRRCNGKRMSPVDEHNMAEVYDVAVNEKFDEFDADMRRFEKVIDDALEAGKTLTKAQLKELRRAMDISRHNTVANVQYVKDRFKEEMAKVVCKSRAEINSYAERMLINTGVKCIMNSSAPDLEEKTDVCDS